MIFLTDLGGWKIRHWGVYRDRLESSRPSHDVFSLGGETMIGRSVDTSMMMAMVCRPRVLDPAAPSILTMSCGMRPTRWVGVPVVP